MPGEKKFSQLPSESPTTNDSFPYYDADTVLTKRSTLSDLIAAIFANASAAQIAAALANMAISRNWLLNGAMNVWQRQITFTPNDDTYIADRWNCLQEANSAWTFARDTDVPSVGGARYSLKATNVTLNNQCGIVQILEGKDAMQLAGKTVSLSFYAKTNGTEIGNLRAAILSWTGTEDSVTSDVISAWAQNGTNPTWAANYTIENSPSNLALTSSWQRFTIENVAIDTSGMKNLAVVIWVDDGTIAAGDDFYITQVQLNEGPEAQAFQGVPFSIELGMCQRYYEKSYSYDIFPGATAADLFYHGAAHFRDNGGANAFIMAIGHFKTTKRIDPTIAWYNPVTGAGTTHARAGGSADVNHTTISTSIANQTTVSFAITTSSNNFHIGSCWVVDAEL